MPSEFLTPVGRIVWGNPAKPQKKTDQKTRQPILKDGKPIEQWVFGLAIPKAEFNQFVLPWLQYEASTAYPNGVPSNFSWKYKDGDGVDRQGKRYSDREGHGGHYILTISTEAFAPQIYKNEGGRYRQIEAQEIKCGDYVVVKINAKVNVPTSPTHTPGLYINPQGIELVGYGQEIISSGADPDEMFGGRQYALPPGATATPQAPQGGAAAPYNVPGQPGGAPAPYAPPAAAPQPAPVYAATPPVQYAPAPASHLPPPAHDFVQNAGYPPAQPAAAPMPAHYSAPAPQAAPVAPGGYAPPPAAAAPGYPPSFPGQPLAR
jgi:hypothetical protein